MCLQITAAISEEFQTSLMTADAQTIIYIDGTSEMVWTYLFMLRIVIDKLILKTCRCWYRIREIFTLLLI